MTAIPPYTIGLARETDEKLLVLDQRLGELEARLRANAEAAHREAGDARENAGYGRTGSWKTDLTDALDRAPKANAEREQLLREAAGAHGQVHELEGIWREHRWTRFWPVFTSGHPGHIHSTAYCHTLNNGRYKTDIRRRPDLSGKTIEDAIAAPGLGPTLCQHCFPDAKAEYKRDPVEVNRERNAVKKTAERAAREAAQAPKKLDPANEAFRTRHDDDRIETVAACKALIGAAVEAAVELEYWESGMGEERYIAEAAQYRYEPDPGWAPRRTRYARKELEEKKADAGEATRVLLAREQAHEGWGITAGALAKLIANAEKRARADRRMGKESRRVEERPLVVERMPQHGVGAARIPGWVDGRSKAIITWRGTDGPEHERGPWTKEYDNSREAMIAMSDLERYVNLELVSAILVTAGAAPEGEQ